MGCGILTTYAEIANIAGIHGLLTYTIVGAIPIFLFSFFGPMIRRRCPDGFVLTEWVLLRFGYIPMLYLSAFTILTMFLFMVAELSAISWAISSTTTVSTTACIIVECAVTTIYTALGGFRVSFLTDSIQAAFVLLTVIIGIIGYGTQIHINRDLIHEYHHQMLGANKLSWQLLYILTVAIITNDCFLSGFWLRTFASRSDRDLKIGTGIAAVVAFVLCFLAGFPGILAVWTGDMTVADPDGSNAFFELLAQMDNWVIGIIIIFFVAISTCTFDSLQSAMTSTISNDVFRNKLNLVYIRVIVVILMVPSVVVAIKAANNVLQIYLIADLVSCAIIPSMFLGLSDKFWWLNGVDVIIGGLGSILFVFIFGTIYYGSAREGGLLLLINNGLYDAEDWGAFGAFLITPLGSILISFASSATRYLFWYLYAKFTKTEFTAFTKPQFVKGSSLDHSPDQESLDHTSVYATDGNKLVDDSA